MNLKEAGTASGIESQSLLETCPELQALEPTPSGTGLASVWSDTYTQVLPRELAGNGYIFKTGIVSFKV